MNKKQRESDYTSKAAIFQSLLITMQRTLFHFAYGLPYMFPLGTGSMNRIGPYISCCVRALPSICRYICDLWEHCFVLEQDGEQDSCETFQEPAWRQQRVCCCGGEASWSCNTFMGDVAKLSLFCSCLPAVSKGWEITMAVQEKNKPHTGCHWKNACVKAESKIPC